MNPIVVNIPGAKLMSTMGAGANRSGGKWDSVREKERQRHGANVHVSKTIAAQVPGFQQELTRRKKNPQTYFCARIHGAGRCTWEDTILPVARVLFTRICPKRHFCDPGGNLATLFKPTEDGTADALGVDDKFFVPTHPSMPVQSGNIGVWYEQIDGALGVRITIVPVA